MLTKRKDAIKNKVLGKSDSAKAGLAGPIPTSLLLCAHISTGGTHRVLYGDGS